MEDIHAILNSGSSCDVIYLDFKKAFDTVSHPELLYKLRKAGVCGDLWFWFQDYLSGRVQHVSINNSISHSFPVTSGVPQGSILGPLLFLIFINDLPSEALHSKLLLFADDAKCFSAITSSVDCHLLQSDLDRLSKWSSNWRLFFNESKCSLLSLFSTAVLNKLSFFLTI